MVKRATSLFNSFCSNAAKQVARFCCPRFTIPLNDSLRKQPTFGDASTGFPAKRRLRNDRRNSILMTRHYPDLGSASDWSCRVGNLFQPITRTTQIWVVLVISSMEFLRSFLRCHFAGKQVVASPNVDSFVRLLLDNAM